MRAEIGSVYCGASADRDRRSARIPQRSARGSRAFVFTFPNAAPPYSDRGRLDKNQCVRAPGTAGGPTRPPRTPEGFGSRLAGCRGWYRPPRDLHCARCARMFPPCRASCTLHRLANRRAIGDNMPEKKSLLLDASGLPASRRGVTVRALKTYALVDIEVSTDAEAPLELLTNAKDAFAATVMAVAMELAERDAMIADLAARLDEALVQIERNRLGVDVAQRAAEALMVEAGAIG